MKILYVTTIGGTMVFFPKHIEMLMEGGHTVELACNTDARAVPETLDYLNLTVHNLPFSRSPLARSNLTALKQLKKLIVMGEYDLVHTHTPNASACVRLACRGLRKKGLKVFYTAHGFHFFKGAPLKNWLIYYPIEWLCSFWTDKLITINQEDFARAKKHFHAKATEYMPGVGLDLAVFEEISANREGKRGELGLASEDIALLSVGELNQNKNHEIVIRALQKLNNPKLHYFIAGRGENEEHLRKLSSELGLENQIHVLGFRRDVKELCVAADIFCFPSKREGLGKASLEAMACGLPLVTSNVHGINDYSIDGVSGFKASPCDIDGFAMAIKKLADSPELRRECGERNREAVKKYDIENTLSVLKEIYK